MVVSLLFLSGTILLLIDLRRRVAAYRDLESRIPDACRLPGLREEVSRLQSEIQQIQEQFAEARVTIANSREAKEWLELNQADVLSKQEILIRTEARLQSQQAELETLYEEKRAIHVECQELQQLQKSLGTMRVAMAEKQEAESWLRLHLPTYEEAQRRLPIVTAELDQQTQQLSLVMQEHEEIQSECRESRQQREWMLREDQHLTHSVDQATDQLKNLKDNLDSYQERQAGLQANLAELGTRLEFKEQEVREIQAELPLAKKELRDVRTEHDQVSAELSSRRAEILQLRSEHQMVTQLLEAAAKRWSEIAPVSGGGDEDRLAELWKPVLNKSAFTGKSTIEELDSLTATENYLTGLGLQFSPRVVRAFHTSLKVSEMSPLVVLAGISGTGKSELPRRYAEGMGMYFLNLAVQPRWDSPQDMFGFYNYLENRYRATELGRALVQMDPFFNEAARGWNYPKEWKEHSLSNRMLLVLLDEMNLARVEYYFSEFLSRLEIRRGINKSNPIDRRKAELALEVGLRSLSHKNGVASIDHQPTLQIFVDSNVMFVGTMNEDETTQTLSDKVVDRANVLRFGRPTRLAPKLANETGSAADRWLSFERWQTWVKTDDEMLSLSVKDDVTKTVEELNAAMQLIGRPFAHRTFFSILSYVANYPDQDSFKIAMADQIELKLLPKFRGLDPQENSTRQAIGKIQSVLGALGDDELVNAIGDCVKGSEHQFVWHGVDRAVSR
jgi:predicted  nucleic acid-binding Zn-ribbon protein